MTAILQSPPPGLIDRFVVWVGPMATVLIVVLLRLILSDDAFEAVAMGEQGVVELGTFAVLLVAIGCGCAAMVHTTALRRWGMVVMTLGAIYFAGEEISWGQHLFGWETPDSFVAINDQQETNLHNTSSWLDQKPRLLLEIWVLLLAITPLVSTLRNHEFFFARGQLWLCAALTIAVKLPERTESLFGLHPLLAIRLSEIQEWMFAWVFLAFLYWNLQDAQCRRNEVTGSA